MQINAKNKLQINISLLHKKIKNKAYNLHTCIIPIYIKLVNIDTY